MELNEQPAVTEVEVSTGKAFTADEVRNFLENDDEGRKVLQSLADARVTKGIESWKERNLMRTVEDEIAKRFPPESEEKKKLRDLEVKQAELMRELQRRDLKAKAIELANERRLPLKIVDRLLGDDEEETLRNISIFEEVFVKAVEEAVEEKFRQAGREPSGSNGKLTSEKRDDLVGQLLESIGN